jgi:hypothetical protein
MGISDNDDFKKQVFESSPIPIVVMDAETFIGFNKNNFRYSREIALTLSSVEG